VAAIMALGACGMSQNRSNWLRAALLGAAVFTIRNLIALERTGTRSSSTRFARPAATFVQWMMDGCPPRPVGMRLKDFMYDCFKRDVSAGQAGNAAIGSHAGFTANSSSRNTLRVMTFNVHFFQRGFSGVVLGDALDEALSIVARLNPDILMLQEVPPSLLPKLQQRLAALDLPHGVSAGSADVHILDPSVGVYARERLHVYLASRLPLLHSAAVPMLDGHAAFAELDLGAGASAYVYSVHLSVRCPGSKRRDEVGAVLQHVASLGEPHKLTLIAGDMNQPNEDDYPPLEWSAIAQDMQRAKLDLSDGAMECMRSKGFVPTFEAAATPGPLPATTAWSGALVDYVYVRAARVLATHTFHTLASDHLPLVSDILV